VEPLAPQDEPQEEDDGDQATVEDEEEHATVEWASEGEHEEDEEASASEEQRCQPLEDGRWGRVVGRAGAGR
jgi:hypothetical protein